MTLAITGATGHFGSIAIQHAIALGTPASELVALVRRPEAATQLAELGVQVRHFDYNEPAELPAALAGVTSLLLVSGTEFGKRAAQHAAVIDAAKAAEVQRIVYTSAPHADASINPVAPEHKLTEEYLVASGLGYVILRNGWYNENFAGDLAAARETGTILTAAGDGTVASAARSDLAEAAAVQLRGQETGTTLTLTGDTAWSFDELADYFTSLLGRTVTAQHVTADQKAVALTAAGVDPAMAGFATGVDSAIAAGELGDVNGVLSSLIGHPTTPVQDTLRAILEA